MRVRRRTGLFWGVTAVLLASCGDEKDPRFESPEATIQTLLSAYGLEHASQDEIQARMRARERFELRDEATYRACFADFDGPEDEGLAGFVFGVVAGGKDQLRFARLEGQVFVYPIPDRNDRFVVLVERETGWKISLEESVPAEIRRALLGEYERVHTRNQRVGGN